ncbi:hypothetical protein [Pisciglobus halotolerans]|uniref:Uncharacterized protein n=1 Tax=Pisciglobus halotolerans TaxID=745365 RepID=A0A1I3C3H0_9LACT|nr:hypothetical protein [Pisciglobus halotolerans]SFH68953.1 hypothetical protein SAMN04489868_11269 [Pisciglobus halotolerans]
MCEVPKTEKQKMMIKLHSWMHENRIKPNGPIKEGFGGYRQEGATRQGIKLYLVNRHGIHVWRGVEKGWRKLV